MGGCVRKIINQEIVDDIDLAVNLEPKEIIQIFQVNNVKFYESGIEHGTITALINDSKFEITSLRNDVETDGRHAKIEFSKNWYEDASRRDFTINAIYADIEGNLYDPFAGKNNIQDGKVDFIGDAEKRINEDFLRILRYVRFFLNYSKVDHNPNIKKIIKKNIKGISKISSERLLDEFKKLAKSKGLQNLYQDKFCLEIISLIFPQFKNTNILKNLKKNKKDIDFIILLSLLINDNSDNTDYFLFRFNLSKKEKNRILFLKEFFNKKSNKNTFTKENLCKVFYYKGKQSLLDILNYQLYKSPKTEKKLLELINLFKVKEYPQLHIKADYLIKTYNLSEGKDLGLKLKRIEEQWVNNKFKISEKEIKKLVIS